MAGIFGIYDPGMAPERLGDLSARMGQVITHEPWYHSHHFLQPPLAAGQVGLGIFNSQTQPASNEDGTVLVWLDGEISDFQRRDLARQLRDSGHQLSGEGDAELLAHLYEDRGESLACDLDGTFAAAIFDRRCVGAQDKLLILVDRDASRPLYFYAQGKRFLFASEVKAILEDHRLPRRVDEQGLVQFFTFRHPLGERTLLRDVHYLPAGCLATFCQGRVQVQRYWEPNVVEDRPPRSLEHYLDELEAGLRLALERQACDNGAVGLFLSGGLDSRLLAGLMPSQLNGRFHTFSRGPLGCWDVKFGTMVADRIGSQHHILELKPDFLIPLARQGVWLTDGLMTVLDIYVLSTIELVKPHVDVVFFGIGRSSGVLAGIELSEGLLQARSLDEAAHELFAREGTYIPSSVQAQLFSRRLYRETEGAAFETLRQILEGYQASTPAGQVKAFYLQCRLPRSTRYGPALARTQVETRFPYSDNDLSELVCRLPAHFRLKRQMQLALLKHARPDLARVPWEYTGVPADVSTPRRQVLQRGLYYVRRKASHWTRGLVSAGSERERANYPAWLRTTLREWFTNILLDKRTLERGYFNETYLRQMISDHLEGRRNYAIQFGLLLTFELWNRLFVDGEPVEQGAVV